MQIYEFLLYWKNFFDLQALQKYEINRCECAILKKKYFNEQIPNLNLDSANSFRANIYSKRKDDDANSKE